MQLIPVIRRVMQILDIRTWRQPDKDGVVFKSERAFLVNHKCKYIYCPIPKVGCTSLKLWLLLTSSYQDKKRIVEFLHTREFHEEIHRVFSLEKYDNREIKKLLEDPEYFKFCVVRNPWERLASAYIDKFVRARRYEDFVQEVIVQIKGVDGSRGASQGISFAEFVDYVCEETDDRLNVHWRPQYCFMGDVEFDFIGRLEEMDAVYEVLVERTGVQVDIPSYNRIERKPVMEEISLSDMPAGEIRRLGYFPDYRNLYSNTLIDKVGSRYREDIKRFGYIFPV